jgi:hypothetical protein
MYFEDMGTVCMIASGPKVRAVGWLSSAYPFDEGKVGADVMKKLEMLIEKGYVHVASAGPHLCELCENERCAANVLVPTADFLYVAPAMIVHYVRDHGYEPPGAFQRAVLRCPDPPGEAYFEALTPFLDVLSPPGRPMTRAQFARCAERHRENLVRRIELLEADKASRKGFF